MLKFFENKLVFHPTTAAEEWLPPPVPDIQDVELTTKDGMRIHAWWLRCPGSNDAILYAHGNAGNLSHRGGSIVKLRQWLNAGVLIFDYPGYGKSQGSPDEDGCYAAGEAAYDWLVQTQKVEPERILLYGGSLGGGIAIELATKKPYRALILAKTFTSAPDVGAGLYPWLPVRWLMSNRFDNVTKIRRCTRPVFIGHGDADRVVPLRFGQKLFEAANEPKQFLLLRGHDHNNQLPEVFFTELKMFLSANP